MAFEETWPIQRYWPLSFDTPNSVLLDLFFPFHKPPEFREIPKQVRHYDVGLDNKAEGHTPASLNTGIATSTSPLLDVEKVNGISTGA